MYEAVCVWLCAEKTLFSWENLFPTVNNRNSSAGSSGIQSGLSNYEGTVSDFEGKSIDELKQILRHERIVIVT